MPRRKEDMEKRRHGDGGGNRIRIYLGLFSVILCVVVSLWQIQAIQAQTRHRDEFPQPYRVAVDTVHNTVTWRAPGNVLLTENFNDYSFPPTGWTISSNGKGWRRSGSSPFLTWIVPEKNSAYALANDDSASVNNDGSLDRLVSPVIDLTSVDSCRLICNSFFNAAYGQAAGVEYRTSQFGPWTEIGTPSAVFDWQNDTADLTQFSGQEGESFFQLAFHADDHGNHASGWAVDDIEVFGKILGLNPVDYLLFWDDEILDSTTAFSYPLPFTYYGEYHRFGICARYAQGNSDTILIDFISHNLPPPQNLEIQFTYDDFIVLDWSYPYHPPYCDPMELQFTFPVEAGGIQGGCETDGQYIYISYQYAPKFDKYDLAGNFIETFTIPGIPGALDLSYDPFFGYMYAGHGGNIIYVMDFTTKTLVDQFTAPCTVRGLAYDPYEGVFYANNLSSRITLFEANGDTLFSFPVGEIGNYYGLAMDWEEGYLWGFSRDETGALMVQYDVAARQPTGLTIDVAYLAENGGQACGLFVNYDLIENCATLGGNLWNDLAFGYSLREELSWGWDPPGVDHYILYNQDTVITESDWGMYYYNQPGYQEKSYKFEVSAWYDLTDFGYPGQFAESPKDGPVYMYGPPPEPNQALDFLEDWESSSFYTHKWDTTGVGCAIQPNVGNPSPSAVFKGMINYGSYEGFITSDWFIVDKEDSCEVLLAYDLKIVDVIPTGQQTMTLEVLDIPSNTWQVLKTYHNDTIMPGFITDRIIVSQYVSRHSLKFRYHNFGIDATDVGYWVIDNIRVSYTCLPPGELKAELLPGQDSVMVSWQYDNAAKQKWLHYDDSIKFINTGFDAGPENWYDVAAKWNVEAVRDYNQYSISGLSFIPTMSEASYILKIWTGDSAERIVYQQIADNLTPGEWHFADVSPPIPIDTLADLWIGYSCSSRGGLPFAMDAGPAIDGFGNLVRINGEWTTMLSQGPGLDYNFIIQARLEKPARNIEAFQVYRSTGGYPFQHVATTDSMHVIMQLTGTLEEECYRTRIICFNRPGFIQVSDFSNADCVTPVSVGESTTSSDIINIFPNPTKGILTIDSPDPIKQLGIYDIQGRPVRILYDVKGTITIDLSQNNPGIDLLKIQTKNSSTTHKIILLHD
jgi:hypothetical protein